MSSMRKQNGRHRLEKQNIGERARTKRILSAAAVALAAGGGLQMVNATASYAVATPNDYHIAPGPDGHVNINLDSSLSEEQMYAVESAALNANGAVLNQDGSLKKNADGTFATRPGSHEIAQFASDGETAQINAVGVTNLTNSLGQTLHGQMNSDGTLKLNNGSFPSREEVNQKFDEDDAQGRGKYLNGHWQTREENQQESLDSQTRIATHELGHGLGLDHPQGAAFNDEVMAGKEGGGRGTTMVIDHNGNPSRTTATTFSDGELALINKTYPEQVSQSQGDGPGQMPQSQESGGSTGSGKEISSSGSGQSFPSFSNGHMDSGGNFIADNGEAWSRNGNVWTNVGTGQTLNGDGVNWETQGGSQANELRVDSLGNESEGSQQGDPNRQQTGWDPYQQQPGWDPNQVQDVAPVNTSGGDMGGGGSW